MISSGGLALLAVGGPDEVWTAQHAARALQELAQAGLEVPMFSQSFSEHSLNLVVHSRDQEPCLQVLCRALGAGLNGADRPDCAGAAAIGGSANGSSAEGIQVGLRAQVATISVVGMPGWNGSGIVAHAFRALGERGTRVIAVAQAASEHSVSFCIPEAELADTVRYLHAALGLA